MTKIIEIALSIPKTVYFNFRYLPFNQAKRLPIAINWRTRIAKMYRGGFVLTNNDFGIIKIGFPYMNFPGLPAIIKIEGTCSFEGTASIPIECQLNVSGTLKIGDHFSCSQGTKIDAKADSIIGNDVLVGHNCYFSDDDGHQIIESGKVTNIKEGYHIGNHVWLCRDCKIMKGANISDGSVVGAGTIVTKKYEEERVMLVGNPVRIVKRNIEWER